MSEGRPPATARQQIAALSDKRLKALAFKAWRAGDSKNDRVRKKAARLRPLLRAELAMREQAGKA